MSEFLPDSMPIGGHDTRPDEVLAVPPEVALSTAKLMLEIMEREDDIETIALDVLASDRELNKDQMLYIAATDALQRLKPKTKANWKAYVRLGLKVEIDRLARYR